MNRKGHIKIAITLILTFCLSGLRAQTVDTTGTKDLILTIGDTITFSSLCDSGAYNHIDMYTKTRYTDSILTYNPMTGVGFYKTFFADGDFDARRLPCTYAGKKFTITSTQSFTDNNTGAERFVVFVMLENWKKVAWIEFVSAYEAGEITLN